MLIPYIIFYLSIFAWLFPPFKNRKTEYFLFFLILAVADPLVYLLIAATKIDPIQIYPFINYALIVSLIEFNKVRKNWILFIIPLIGLFLASFFLSFIFLYGIKILLSSIILFFFLKAALLYVNKHQSINLFFLLLILYEITIVVKYIFVATHTRTGIIYFFIMSFFETFLGIYFTFFNVNSSLKFNLIKVHESPSNFMDFDRPNKKY
jgi:hypothetical protein